MEYIRSRFPSPPTRTPYGSGPGPRRLRGSEKAQRRTRARYALAAQGVLIQSHPSPAHMRVRTDRSPWIDFWPDSGVWTHPDGGHRRGLRRLIGFLHHDH